MTRKKNFLPETKSLFLEKISPASDTFDILENAWNDLPRDMTYEERRMFIEIVQRLIKTNSDTRMSFRSQKSLRQN
jgi:hypothetical protein